MQRNLDIVVFGATGFTGQLILAHLAKISDASRIKVGAAARDGKKLADRLASLGIDKSVEPIIADAKDHASLDTLARRSKTVIAAAGPFQHFGSGLIQACANNGTDYVDLAGESHWIRQMIDTHSDAAAKSGARIVHSCGFDSVPSDLGVFLLQSLAREKFGQRFSRVKCRVEAIEGIASGGTVASIMSSMGAAQSDPELAALMTSPFALTPDYAGPEQPSGNEVVYDDDLRSWAAPFIMASINTKTVHRSNFLLAHKYGKDFIYDEMIGTGPGKDGEKIARGLSLNDMLEDDGRVLKPGEGPTKEQQEAGHFTVAFHGQFQDGRTGVVRVQGFKDTGYGATSQMISDCALCLLKDKVDLGGGFWTPATIGQPLINRLSASKTLSFQSKFSS